MHIRHNGNKSPKYGLIASELTFAISQITLRMADTNAEVALSPSNFLIRHDKIDVEYDLAISGADLTNIMMSLTASSRSFESLLCSIWEMRDTMSYLRYGRICDALCGTNLPRILTVRSLISKFWSCMQLKSIRRFSYLEMKGSNYGLRCLSIVTLIRSSLSVVAVTKNRCKSLLIILSIVELILM